MVEERTTCFHCAVTDRQKGRELFGVRLMGWAAFSDLWHNAGIGYRLGLSGIFLGLAAAPAAGVLFVIGGFAWLAVALLIGAMALIVPANYERVQAIKRYRTDWYS
jgi:hypothetical protein